MRVLVSGASGFVGRCLVRHLLEVRPDVDILGTTQHTQVTSWDPRLRFAACDITANSGEDVRRLVAAEQPDFIFHLAGISSGAVSDHDAVFLVNVAGTQNLMTAAALEAPRARCLFASSGYVYGQCDERHPAREDDPLRPIGVYAESKREAEKYAAEAGALVARAFNHTGPEQPDTFVVSAFAKQIARIEAGRQPPQIEVGNLDVQRDFLDVRDVVRGYHAVLTQEAAASSFNVYNICRGEAFSLTAVLAHLLSLSSHSIEVISSPHRLRPNDFSVSVGDRTRLTSCTGWLPEIPLSQTLADTLNWWRANLALG